MLDTFVIDNIKMDVHYYKRLISKFCTQDVADKRNDLQNKIEKKSHRIFHRLENLALFVIN